jgi:hypothetical protein
MYNGRSQIYTCESEARTKLDATMIRCRVWFSNMLNEERGKVRFCRHCHINSIHYKAKIVWVYDHFARLNIGKGIY